MTVALDTLSIVRKLRAAGFSEDQAEAVTTVVRDSRDADLAMLATKTDLQTIRADIDALKISTKTDLRETELRLEAKIESVRSDILKWVVGAIGFQTVVIVGTAITLAKLFTH